MLSQFLVLVFYKFLSVLSSASHVEDRAGLYASRAFVSFSWCHGLALPGPFINFPFKKLLSSLGFYEV